MGSNLVEVELQESDLRNEQSMSHPEVFPIVQDMPLDYNDFYRQYLETNTPCLIRNYIQMKDWQSCEDWTDLNKNAPNLSNFKKIIDINDHLVPVSNCGKRYYNYLFSFLSSCFGVTLQICYWGMCIRFCFGACDVTR